MKRYDQWANLVYFKLAKGNLENEADMANLRFPFLWNETGEGTGISDVVQPLSVSISWTTTSTDSNATGFPTQRLRESAM
jgi:hypothetical protein